MDHKNVVRRWKSELANTPDNPAGMVELDQFDQIAGGQGSPYTIDCSTSYTACCQCTYTSCCS